MSRRAFTLIELLVVVAIIAVLIGILAFSLRGVRAAATRTVSLGALRQIMMGYSGYTQDHSGQLLPGYIGADLFNTNEPFDNLRVSFFSGGQLSNTEDKQSYVWRLAPYLDGGWQTFFEDMNDIGAMSEFEAEYDDLQAGASFNPDGLSERPSFGLNSIFMGGDSVHGGPIAALHPWTNPANKIAATRLSEVVNPVRVIVFGPAAKAAANADDVYDEPAVGFCELRPPLLQRPDPSVIWTMLQWEIGANGLVESTVNQGDDAPAGLPIARTAGDVLYSGKESIPVGHLDGSTGTPTLADLSKDMRRWDPFEVALRGTESGP